MNQYIVVEGLCSEQKVYPSWILYTNSALTQVFDLADIVSNNYYMISGMGYPQYFEIIQAAIDDVNTNETIDQLVICVDSEEMSFAEKKDEIEAFVEGKIEPWKVVIVIQHYCLETWALGNQVIHKRNPQDETLRKYIRFHDACHSDPELIPNPSQFSMNRAQFCTDYLRRTLREKYPKLTYSKRDPSLLAHPKYFERIRLRFEKMNHIDSFSSFIGAFSDNTTT